MQELRAIGGSQYSCMEQLDKGLTRKLLAACHLVMWDTPGTGMVECLSSNIPTLVYWPRTYTQEEAWVKPLFGQLEEVGIVHRDVDTLMDAVESFKNAPHLWMNEAERMSVTSRFCREFAWTSDDWPKRWRQYLDGLSDGD